MLNIIIRLILKLINNFFLILNKCDKNLVKWLIYIVWEGGIVYIFDINSLL
jgi:hypothetical protein